MLSLYGHILSTHTMAYIDDSLNKIMLLHKKITIVFVIEQ